MSEKEGINRITGKILEEARAEAAAVKAEAETRAAARLEEAEQAYKAKLEEAEQVNTLAVSQQAALAAGALKMERKKQLLAAKQELVSLCYERVCEKIKESPEGYTVLLLSFIQRACESVSALEKEKNGELTQLFLSDGDRKVYGAEIEARCHALGIKIEGVYGGGDPSGGVIVKNGDIYRNYSMDAVISQLRQLTEEQVVDLLFAEACPSPSPYADL